MKLGQKESRELKRKMQDELLLVLQDKFEVTRIKQGVAIEVQEGLFVVVDAVVKQDFDIADAIEEYEDTLKKEAEAIAKKLAKEKEKESK